MATVLLAVRIACVLFEYFASEVLMFTPPARTTPRFFLLNSLSTDY